MRTQIMRLILLITLLLACFPAFAETPRAKTFRIMSTTKVTMTEPKITMEKAIEQLSDVTGVTIRIMVDALAAKGITTNQSLRIDMKDTAAENILLEIMDETDPQGRLQFLIEDDGAIAVGTWP